MRVSFPWLGLLQECTNALLRPWLRWRMTDPLRYVIVSGFCVVLRGSVADSVGVDRNSYMKPTQTYVLTNDIRAPL